MTDSPPERDDSALPTPDVRQQRRWTLSLIWLVPIIAALAGIVLGVRALLSSGPEISVRFRTAEGLEAGKTEVRYKDVVVGQVRRIRLSDDRQTVVVKIELTSDAASLAAEDTRFWVVRPRVGMGGVSGLNTLLSGAYIGVDVGQSTEERREFDGLEVPPAVTSDQKGRRYVLKSDDLGSLDIGSPVYYRRTQVGRVVGHQLRDDGRGVLLEVFVDAPYDRYVTQNTRFWNASGVDITVNASGFKLDTESLATVVAGGVAFEAPGEEPVGEIADENAQFNLFNDRNAALAPADGVAMDVRMRFNQSMRGLTLGSPVDFRGVTLGVVSATSLEFDRHERKLYAVVDARIYPERLGPMFRRQIERSGDPARAGREFFARLSAAGLRAQLRPGNLLTGQLYVALDFDKKAKPVKLATDAEPFELATAAGGIEEIQQQIASIVAKIDEIPFGDIGRHLDSTLQNADSLLKQLDGELAPEARGLLKNAREAVDNANRNLVGDGAPLQRNAQVTLEAVERMSRSMRELTDYLKRHPEALIFGTPDAAEPRDDGATEKAP